MTQAIDTAERKIFTKEDLEPFLDRTVDLVVRKDQTEETWTCVVKALAPVGFMIQHRGKSKSALVLYFEVVSISVSDQDSTFKPKRVPVVPKSRVRRHLLDAHGYTVGVVTGLSDDQAMVTHDVLHQDPGLGHFHEGELQSR